MTTIQFDAKKYALIDLHLHLDGSLTADDIIKMAEMSSVKLPTTDSEQLEKLLKCPADCKDLNDYLRCFDLPLQVLQTENAIEYAVQSLVERLDKQGLLYAEIRFAPQLHLAKGLTQTQVVTAALNGLNKALTKTDLSAQLILCCMRSDSNEKENFETLDVTKAFLNKGVCACDLAGAEGLYKTSLFKNLFEYVRNLQLPFTIHAGEADGVISIENAVSFGASRIGHGIRSYNDETTKKLLAQKKVPLELCPTSNLNTAALVEVKNLSQYPISAFLESNVLATVNTDNMTVSNTTLFKEFEGLFSAGAITEPQAVKLVKNAVTASFLSGDAKAKLLKKCESRMNAL